MGKKDFLEDSLESLSLEDLERSLEDIDEGHKSSCRLKKPSDSGRYKKGHPPKDARSAEDMIKSGNRQVKSR